MSEKIDEYLWQINLYLMRRYGVDAANNMLYPLKWYINTGRAPTMFLKRLLMIKPYVIGRVLYNNKDASIDNVVFACKKKVEKVSK